MAGDEIRRLLEEIDQALAGRVAEGQRLDVYLIGRSALVLQYGTARATKDVDVLDRTNRADLLADLETMFGKDSKAAERLGVYLEKVAHALPPTPAPGRYQRRCTEAPGDWQVIRPLFLEPNDYAVTKLRRFWPKDREDVRFLCDRGLLNAAELRTSFESAFADYYKDYAFREPAEKNLEQVIAYLEGRSPAL